MDPANCPVCGSDALVTILVEDEEHGRRLRSYCRECERRQAEQARDEVRPLAEGLARLLVYGGVLLALLTATADYLAISGRSGFGWRQITGVEVGFLAIVLGLALRKGLLGMAGLFLLVLSIGADLLHIGHFPGLGWRSHVGFVVATALLVGGFFWHRALQRGKGLPRPRVRAGRSPGSHTGTGAVT
jgi:hypothetical protein